MEAKETNIILGNLNLKFSSPNLEDAKKLAQYFKQLFHESAEYLNFTENYYDDENITKQEKFIQNINKEKGSFAIFVFHENIVVAHIVIKNMGYERAAHRASLAMGVLKDYRSKGIGSKLVELSINNCEFENLLSLELRVRSNNTHAIALYEKYGFECIGEVPAAAKVNDCYISEFLYVWSSPKLLKENC